MSTLHVALAGGAGSLGGKILSGLATHPTKKYKITVLTRSPQPALTAQGITVKTTDYTSLDDLTTALSGVDIVISTLISIDEAGSSRDSQLLLIEAAKRAGVRRFAPSEWAISGAANEAVKMYKIVKIEVWEALKSSGMQYTAFRPGVFMNYFAYGSQKPGVMEQVFDGVRYGMFVFDISSMEVHVPGTGDERLNFTLIEDVGRLVASAIDQDEVWGREENGMAGSVVTFNGIIKEVERITGKKVNVKYQSIPYLEQKVAEESTIMGKFDWEIRLAVAKGQGYIEPVLNKNTPDVKLMGITEFLEKWWGKDE